MSRERYYVPALDGLRFFAFLLVYFHHSAPSTLPGADIPSDWQVVWHAMVMAGAFGVPIFFALSAFLLTTLLQREKQESGKVDLGAFYVRRILRIWPLYFLVLLLDGVAYPFFHHQTINGSNVAAFLLFLGNFRATSRDAVSMPLLILWSVCMEEQFYIVWPWLNRQCSPKLLRGAAWGMVVTAIIFRVTAAISGKWWTYAWFDTLGHLDSLGFGALAALQLVHTRTKPVERTILIMSGFACPLLVGWMAPISGIESQIGLAAAILYTMVALSSAILVWGLATAPAKFKTPFSNPTVASFGRISYGLYAFHTLVLALLMPFLSEGWWPVLMLAGLVLTLGVSWLSFRFFESRFLAIKTRFQFIPSGAPLPGSQAAKPPP